MRGSSRPRWCIEDNALVGHPVRVSIHTGSPFGTLSTCRPEKAAADNPRQRGLQRYHCCSPPAIRTLLRPIPWADAVIAARPLPATRVARFAWLQQTSFTLISSSPTKHPSTHHLLLSIRHRPLPHDVLSSPSPCPTDRQQKCTSSRSHRQVFESLAEEYKRSAIHQQSQITPIRAITVAHALFSLTKKHNQHARFTASASLYSTR